MMMRVLLDENKLILSVSLYNLKKHIKL